MHEVIQRRLIISGKVQGVGFRSSTREAAVMRSYAPEMEMGEELRGFVRNLANGDVEAVFCGTQEAVMWMVAWCHHGPIYARVDRVKVYKETPNLELERFLDVNDFGARGTGTNVYFQKYF
jgi:acylphosphatase